ncbi:hypothetical protein RYZ27_11605 [Hyphomonas sp. FCG-A18]|jgi:hypothetical protein|uniref:hypothetical protein n=1 Tax=Hyphomonas sp. FCG-A18 TaxID=3080019 RepID=UPI002B2897EE|nr:hypothetical protein RYZ27_11605 [Hyphomonas sp. FCG-A18]
MKALITLIAAVLFGAIQMACACDVLMNEDSSSAHQSHETETHNSDQHLAPDGPCDGCEHCDVEPVFAEINSQIPAFKVDQKVKPSIILVGQTDLLVGHPATGPPDKRIGDLGLRPLTPLNLKVRFLN